MDDVITLSSDSDEDESDVEIIGSYSNITTKPDPQPLTAVRVYVDAVDVKVPTVSLQISTLPLVFKLAVQTSLLCFADKLAINHALYIKHFNPKNRLSYITGNFSRLSSIKLSQIARLK